MLSTTLLTANQIYKLQLQLSLFGLHPIDWTIQKNSKLTFKIKNKSEETFYFIGTLKNESDDQWAKIYLASL